MPDAAATVEVVADITRRCIDVGMTLKAPGDRKTTRARVNWLLRQIRSENLNDLYLRLHWPGKSDPTQFPVVDLKNDVSICDEGKAHLVAHSFHVFCSRRTGSRFTQQVNFIADLEAIVPEFYGSVGAYLAAWKPGAPRIRQPKENAEDVTTEAISEDSESFEA